MQFNKDNKYKRDINVFVDLQFNVQLRLLFCVGVALVFCCVVMVVCHNWWSLSILYPGITVKMNDTSTKPFKLVIIDGKASNFIAINLFYLNNFFFLKIDMLFNLPNFNF